MLEDDIEILLPAHGWQPRPHQLPLWRALQGGKLRAIDIAHRRWGKDDVCLHWTARAAHIRPGGYWHCLPEFAQARKAIWTAVNPHTGRRRIDEAFPLELRANTNDHEMFIRFKNGSTWQVIGSDRYDNLVGASVAGIVFSEWALANPAAWAYFAPILTENEGWAIFITTSRGRNHAKSMLDMARTDPDWFAEVSTVRETQAISLEAVEKARLEYHAIFGEDEGDALIDQEYFCSFDAAVLGSFYGKEMARAEADGRVCDLDVSPHYPVQLAWDLGIGVDGAMAIWAFQITPGRINFVDYIEATGYDFAHYTKQLDTKGYHGTDWVPHDARAPVLGGQGEMPRTRIEAMVSLGRNPALIQNHLVVDGIGAVRRLLAISYFDRRRCAKGLDCLREYRREWDEEHRVFKKTALHNWASHGADAFRYAAMSTLQNVEREPADRPSPVFKLQRDLTMNEVMALEDSAPRGRDRV